MIDLPPSSTLEDTYGRVTDVARALEEIPGDRHVSGLRGNRGSHHVPGRGSPLHAEAASLPSRTPDRASAERETAEDQSSARRRGAPGGGWGARTRSCVVHGGRASSGTSGSSRLGGRGVRPRRTRSDGARTTGEDSCSRRRLASSTWTGRRAAALRCCATRSTSSTPPCGASFRRKWPPPFARWSTGTAVGGPTCRENENPLAVRLQVARAQRASEIDLGSLYFSSMLGPPVPASDIGSLHRLEGTYPLMRKDLQPFVSVTAEVTGPGPIYSAIDLSPRLRDEVGRGARPVRIAVEFRRA
jgi:hypothetical protein